jgi:hypothetical protein
MNHSNILFNTTEANTQNHLFYLLIFNKANRMISKLSQLYTDIWIIAVVKLSSMIFVPVLEKQPIRTLFNIESVLIGRF